MVKCKWLPELYDYPDWNNYSEYEEKLYTIFKQIYLDCRLFFKRKVIRYRYKPKFNNKEEVFYHCTCKNYNVISEREPDPNRIIRIKWIKSFIENYICNYDCCDEKPITWIELYKKNKNYRHYIYFRRYLVILEERENYFLLITGFYVEEDYYHHGLIKRYKKAENAIKQ